MHLNNAFRIIKEVQKKFKQYENEKKEMEDVIEQETLKITQTKGNTNCNLSCKLTSDYSDNCTRACWARVYYRLFDIVGYCLFVYILRDWKSKNMREYPSDFRPV